MGYYSSIRGVVNGISEDSFELIRKELEDCFEEVSWHDNAIEIDSYRKHCDELLHPVYDKIAFCIDGAGGQLDEDGEECGDVSSIFFAPRKWTKVWAEITYPPNPFARDRMNIAYAKVALVPVSPSMLEAIKSEPKGLVSGGEYLWLERDDLKSRLAAGELQNEEVIQFVTPLLTELTEEIRGIVFRTVAT